MSDYKYRNSISWEAHMNVVFKANFYFLSLEPENLCKLLLQLLAEKDCTELDV